LIFREINLGQNNYKRFGLEKRLNVVEQTDLLWDCVATGFRYVEEEQDTGIQVSQRGNGLHFDSVSLIKWMIQDARCIDNLPFGILVIRVTHE